MKLMPFNFDRINDDTVFLSNLAGFHQLISEDSFSQLVRHSLPEDKSLADALESKLFISEDDEQAFTTSVLSSGFAKRIMSDLAVNPIFMIVPTLRCDHTCKYCQVSRAAVGANNYDLDPALIPAIVNQIKKLSVPPYKIEVQGGEPLLRFDLVKLLYEQCEENLGADAFEMVIATSLSLLDSSILTWVKERNITFSVSLDGSETIHNKNRVLTGNESHSKAVEGIRRIKEDLGNSRVSTVTTVTKELIKNPSSIIDAHLVLGLTDLFVRPVSPYGFAHKDNFSFSMDEYYGFYEKLIEDIVEHNKNGIPVVEHSAAIHLKRIFNPGFSGYADLKSPSGVVLNCILFNYDGRVYGSDESRMLQKVNSDVDFSAGEIASMSFSKSDYYRTVLASSFNFALPGCDTCAYQPFCGSDPCQNISMQGEPVGDRSKSTFCQYHKGMFRFLIDKLAKGGEVADVLRGWAYV
ncbi:His-Xaa-Ser system radical SAM maturase HxsB [Serratia marcescens]|uniref:His-Xaa-Ser system radical SAM maturase HxsB n=1 Tax=Serratia TaxID=613 RepID=UPI000B40C6AE|nr:MULTISPECIES: His-Xaa-Ser system radical SAM maturase HxsB [Serratia]RNW02883.1 His-Xaa-Ser system radical SAM maturase HxsB [Serratia nematodiphila]ELQ9309326.1 His-Xaa-Ser system radical SAM maturase HxsB [Serratia marcescens]ELQ9439114.1 His-Xaa-Ser system radical SAM maturase HxsB [Serratia marcescens]ELT5560501.1 His-Xaa-Ser system radical SAM maturase HxsB [Serratia marcescens]MBH3130751.1 His-Xaa-Ser system radical SAM maturase HxsB [Serratia marcescens]